MRLNRLVAGPALPGCGKTQIPPGLGKGTGSTCAVTAAESIATSSRWRNAALQKNFFSSLLVLALLLGGRAPLQYAFAQVQHNSGNQEPLIAAGQRKPAPNFILPDAKGDTINLSTYKGKVVLLDFWATWCGGCKTEIPWYMEFDSKYKNRGLAVIGVSMDQDGWKTVKPFLAMDKDPETGGHTAMKYPVVIGSDSLAKQYNSRACP